MFSMFDSRKTEVILSVLYMCFQFLITLSAKSQTISPVIVFTERVYRLDTIDEKDGIIQHTFTLYNKGKAPVSIERIYTGCLCTKAVLSKKILQPDEEGVLQVAFDPSYRAGFFSTEIAIFTNQGKYFNHVWIEGVVRPYEPTIEEEFPYAFGAGLFLKSAVLSFGYMKRGRTKKQYLYFANNGDSAIHLSFKAEGVNSKKLQYVDPGLLEPKQRGKMSVYYMMPIISGVSDFFLYPYVNGKKLDEAVMVKIAPYFQVR